MFLLTEEQPAQVNLTDHESKLDPRSQNFKTFLKTGFYLYFCEQITKDFAIGVNSSNCVSPVASPFLSKAIK